MAGFYGVSPERQKSVAVDTFKLPPVPENIARRPLRVVPMRRIKK